MHTSYNPTKSSQLASDIGKLFTGYKTAEIALALGMVLASFTRVAKHATLSPERQISGIARMAINMQRDNPTPPKPDDKPWNDDTAIPDVTEPGWMDPKPGEPLNPPSGDPTKH